ncbi:MAG: FimD/PapC N-terminal domain-containing protein, partial [Stenotrophomonas sp.]
MRRDALVPRLAPLAVALNALGISSAIAAPNFNLDFLRGTTSDDDIAALSNPGAILPGTYPFAIYLNGNEVAREDIKFTMSHTGQAEPCLPRSRIRQWGIRLDDLGVAAAGLSDCVPLTATVPNAGVSYNGNQQRLDLRIPQVHLINLPRGHIPRALRDQGINALLVDYAFNGAHNNHENKRHDDYFFASINSTLNAGMWRFRHTASANRSSNGKGIRWA